MSNWPLYFIFAAEGAKQPDAFWSMAIMFGPPILLLFILQTVFGRNDARDKAKQDTMISNLKKNDPVVTIGGIVGTFVSHSADKKEVTIKVDDTTRLKVLASAIREVAKKETT